MIIANTKSNINANKVNVDKYNTQMTTQKKINKPSDDPVIAIRSLRMQTKLSHIDQYLDNNITDANAWLEVTDTALKNMVKILESIRTQCVDGSTDTLNADNRNTILEQLEQMADQVYSEGNADYAGRTIFTGYRTTSMLTFQDDEEETTYDINQTFSYNDIEDHRYYYGSAVVPVDLTTQTAQDLDKIGETTNSRIRLAYDDIDSLNSISYSYSEEVDENNVPATVTQVYSSKDELEEAKENNSFNKDESYYVSDGNGKGTLVTVTSLTVQSYGSEDEWEGTLAGEKKEVGDNDAIFIRSTGELIIGSKLALSLKENKADISVSYTKTGFDEGELRPEYYYDCTKTKENGKAVDIEYKNYDDDGEWISHSINYEISSSIYLAANTEAKDVLDTSIGREVNELIDIVSAAINAHDKVDQIQSMIDSDKYADEESQEKLQAFLEVAKKEAAYADDNMQKAYSQGITDFNNYLEKVTMAQTNVGCKEQRLSLTKTRVENQKETVEELKTENDNREISDIIIDYYAAYNAYTASLTAAAKVNSQTLLNYL
jgi:flagellar hook-associated protein 3 FlgL